MSIEENNKPDLPEQIKLTAQQFINALEGNDRRFLFKQHKKYSIQQECIVFENIIIEERIELNDEEAQYSLTVCIGENTFFNNDFVIETGTFYNTFFIDNGLFSERFFILGGTFMSTFSISGGLFKNGFFISGGLFKNGFFISGGDFSFPFTIYNGDFQYHVLISGGKFNSRFSIIGGNFSDEVHISEGTFSSGFRILDAFFCSNFFISGGTYDSDFVISNGVFSSGLTIFGGTFLSQVSIYGGYYACLNLCEKAIFKNDFIIGGGYFADLTLNLLTSIILRVKKVGDNKSVALLLFRLENDLKKESLLSIEDAIICKIEWDNFINNGQCYFKHIQKGEGFQFKKDENGSILLDNKGGVIFDVEENTRPLLTISNSDLGKTTFIDCDLSGFDLNFKSSKISEVFLAGTEMPAPENINKDANPRNYDQNRLALSQIKKIYENRGDAVNATLYHKRELEEWMAEVDSRKYTAELDKLENKKLIYLQFKKMYEQRGDLVSASEARAHELNLHYEYLKQLKKSDHRKYKAITSRSERFNLWLNKISNNHGENWLQALLITLGVSLGLYALYCISLNPYHLNSKTVFANYFDFLNPIHKSDFFTPVNTDWAPEIKNSINQPLPRIIDGISRIIIAYLIYQLIQAFRKYGRR